MEEDEDEKITVEARTLILTKLSEWEAFKGSTIWKDMSRELIIWDRMAVGKYDACTKIEDFTRLNGSREAFRNFLALPDNFIQVLTLDEEKERKKKETNDFS
jgi:hypothetical protein